MSLGIKNKSSFASKVSESYFSFTPGQSPVIVYDEIYKNRFNGFSVRLAWQSLHLNRLQFLEKKSKPLKRFTNLLLCVSPG